MGVGLVDIDQERVAQAASDIASRTGSECVGIAADIADRNQLAGAWSHLESLVGTIDAVINCAGTFVSQALEDITPEDWEFALRTNLTGPFVTCQQAAAVWRQRAQPGSIVNISSTAATNAGFFEATSYGAAKAGLQGLSIHLAHKLGSAGIRVNCVAPGSFRSPMNSNRLSDPDEVARSIANIPLGRVAEVGEIAAAAVYLALDAAYVTGTILRADGGLLTSM
ncbi:MAG: family oxidoreductase [Microbacteriaceae bacterium]|nr:family oxidoreductase [Microbacteriaceae bacterium]